MYKPAEALDGLATLTLSEEQDFDHLAFLLLEHSLCTKLLVDPVADPLSLGFSFFPCSLLFRSLIGWRGGDDGQRIEGIVANYHFAELE